MNPEPTTPATFITFYSFKGGVGRSMALINTASILAAQRGFRVLVIDLDLEAPGLSYLNPDEPESSSAEQPQYLLNPGFVDLMADAKAKGETADLFTLDPQALELKYSQSVDISKAVDNSKAKDKPRDGSLRVMPAGRIDQHYARNMELLDLNELYRAGVGEPLVRAFKKKLAESGLYDYVLVDSRTGLSDLAGICTRDLADHVMVLSGLNRQNLEGTSEFLRVFREATHGKKTFQIILSPVPNGEDDLMDQRRELAEKKFSTASGTKVKLTLEIPYHPQLALTEEPHIFRRRRGYLFEAYKAIERDMLREIGHTAEMFYRRAQEALKRETFSEAERELRHMVRLNGGPNRMLQLLDELFSDVPQPTERDQNASEKKLGFNSLLKSEPGKQFLDFVLMQVPIGLNNSVIKRAYQLLRTVARARANKLLRRVLKAAKKEADELANWAIFLDSSGNWDQAETFYKLAVELDSKHAVALGSYAPFLEEKRKDLDKAEIFYKRAIESAPKQPTTLANYADFLEKKRSDLDGAESCYKAAIEADPKYAHALGKYALFLQNKRGNFDGAENYYKRAIEVAPTSSYYLGNYAQLLFARGRMREAEERLRQIWIDHNDFSPGDAAEVCFVFWLLQRATDRDSSIWERRFKFLLAKGFKRYPWSFDSILAQGKGRLSAQEFEYAQALAAAHQDEKKVAALEAFPHWHELKPLDPKQPDPELASQA